MGLGGVRQGQPVDDQRLDQPARDHVERVLELGAGGADRAQHRDVVGEQLGRVEARGRAAHRPDQHPAAVPGHASPHEVVDLRPDILDRDVDAAPARERAHLGREVDAVRHHHDVVGAEGADRLRPGLAGRHRDHARAHRPRDLHPVRALAAIGAGHQDMVADLHPADIADRVELDADGARYDRRLLQRDAVGHQRDAAFVDRDALGIAAVEVGIAHELEELAADLAAGAACAALPAHVPALRRADPVADLQAARHGADRLDHAGDLVPRHQRGAHPLAVDPVADHDVVVADAARRGADQHVGRTQRRHGDLAQLEDLGPAGAVLDDRLHCSSNGLNRTTAASPRGTNTASTAWPTR